MRKESDAPAAEPMRIDRWLFFVRLFKSRSLASAAVTGGKVHVNAERVKPARVVRVGDRITFNRGAVPFECAVLALPWRRGPAPAAAACYRESEGSVARRAQFAERMRTATAFAPRPDSRPDKHERRELRRIRGRD
ncbi:MAG TPA: RNA-binding S4 domain-containing protein [Steroidobacteraceae bacterium]|jgi:ribosome-associated heat shock protein Hsp15|nr:RNA-binding S4 domain-containing protein [Steroidobacteraceae bacterium]